MKQLSLLYIELTTECNSKCKYCDYWKINPYDMDMKLLKRVETQFKKFRISNLIFTGGEPLLHSNFIQIVEKIKNMINPKICTLMTNGLLLKKYENEISNFFNRIVISIDGFDEHSYNETRGINGFKQVLDNINFFKEKYKTIEIRIKTTLHPELIPFIPNFIEVAKKNKINRISFNALDTVSQNAFFRTDIQEERKYILNMINNVISKLEKNQDTQIMVEDIDILKKTLLRNTQKSSTFPKCNALDSTIIIHSNGDVRLCFFTQIIGNILNNTLEDILQSDKVKNLKNKFQTKNLKECLNCVCPYYIPKEGDMPYRA